MLVVGGGLTGLETAEFLAEQGKEIVLVEMLKRIGADMGGTVRWHLMNRTKNLSIKTFVSTQIKEIRAERRRGGVAKWRRGDLGWLRHDSAGLRRQAEG